MSADDEEYEPPPMCAECGAQGKDWIGFTHCDECGNDYCSTHAYKVGQCIYEESEW